MLKAILVDDEINALKGLELELSNFSNLLEVVKRFTNATNAIEYLQSHEIDLVFLDIEMPDMNGIAFLEQFSTRNFFVVFTTAYSRYAIDALKLDADDYLLKPIDVIELDKCLTRIRKKMQQKGIDSKLEEALTKLNTLEKGGKKIKLSHDNQITFLESDEIIYCEAKGNYSNIFLTLGKKILLTMQLKQLQELLPEDTFFRIHNSYIINMSKVLSYNKSENLIVLNEDIHLPVSRSNRSDMLDKI